MNSTTKKVTDDKNITGEKTVRISIGFPQSDYKVMQELAREGNTSIANVARIAVNNGLNRYFSTLRYIDSNQGARIESTLNDLSYSCRNILNNVHRIDINYTMRYFKIAIAILK